MQTSTPKFLKTGIAAAALLLSLAVPAFAAIEVGGVKFEDSAKVAGKDLKLNGAGVRVRAVFKIYAIGIYTGKKETAADAVINGAGPRRFQIVMLRDITADDFGQAFMGGINANTDKAEKSKIINQMVKFGEIFAAQGSLKKGDSMNVDWVPEKGTTIELNGKSIADPIPDVAFYNALLKIWLGDKPVDTDLKPLLLGAKPQAVAINTGGN